MKYDVKGRVRAVLTRTTLLSCLAIGLHVASPAAADTLRVIADGDMKIPDPMVTTSWDTQVHAYLIYDKLFEMDESGSPQPELAEKVEASSNLKSFTISLRKGLKFSDGSPLTTDDVIQSLKRWSSRDVTGLLFAARLKNMSKLDDQTFRIEMSEPFDVPEALAGITGNPAFIMPKRVATNPPTDAITDATGSGPYMFDLSTWQAGQTREYTKNPFYVPRKEPPSYYSGRKVAMFDKIEISYVPDPNTALAGMLTGKFDIWSAPPMDSVVALRGKPDLVVDKGTPAQGNIRPNYLVPPFNNVKARQALAYLIDQSEINLLSVGDPQFWRTCYAYLKCGSKYGDEGAYTGHRGVADYDKAKTLLQESGYKGEPIVILDPTDAAYDHAQMLYVAAQLRKIGANVDVQSMDWSTLASRRISKKPASEGGWNLFSSIMEGEAATSPLRHLQLASNCENAWFGWPCDAEIEQLRAAFIGAKDDDQRKEVAYKLQKRASEYLPFILTGESNYARVHRSDIEGFNAAAPRLYFWNITRKGM
ncbi:ABC transporter substrate-binding protein [Rhizobium mesoamericanum]|uniref:ABC transporter periplasmic protein n=1 Tax=Rhizobium mesoamericanum STM3625 TaxID=1211777 RepID=K0PSY3_9HYPH|nr:ABC transporter substrate-binding protein [Rhizobium mesoamericanum]CCM79851.1 ABC transporter periplasmic protein [Rhizobium mesoamericanum STM3625]